MISIPALREEGDRASTARRLSFMQFLSPPSARRATRHWLQERQHFRISIPALREEGDQLGHVKIGNGIISIPALREEGDVRRSE